MNASKDNNGWTKLLIGFLWVCLTSVVGMEAKGIIENNERSILRDDRLGERTTENEKALVGIGVQLTGIKEDISESKVIQQKILDKLERI